MIGLLILAAVSRCAAAALCPSDAELKQALNDQASAEIEAYLTAERARNPGDVISAHPIVIRRIADVHCGAAEPGKAATVRCSVTVFAGGDVRYEMADFAWRDGQWAVVKAMSVLRERPR